MERLKSIVILALVVLLSFGLGYLIRGESEKAPIIIEKNSS